MVQTHELIFTDSSVVKRYTSWERGEHRREWLVLNRVHEHAPDLGPRPLAADLESVPPAITMSAVRGAPLTVVQTTRQTEALRRAITTLWAVPCVADFPPWTDDLEYARRLTALPRPSEGVVATAYDAATAWWNGPDPDLLRQPPATTILGHRDPNIANYLWDGRRVRIVDFEDAAASDPATELAILMEHLSWRDIDVGPLRIRLDVDERRLLAARRLWAMFWLWLLLSKGQTRKAEQQANRVLKLMRR